MGKERRKEIEEAIDVGINVIRALETTQEYLNNASKWGGLDIIGGNIVTGAMKYSNLNKANKSIKMVQWELERFCKELKDIQMTDMNIEIDSFLSMADFIFDGLVADILVQRKIEKYKNQVRDAIFRVEKMIEYLRFEYLKDQKDE